MSNEKRRMVLTLTFSECTQAQADAILATVTTLAGASADVIDAPVFITACPPDAPENVRKAATRTMRPKSKPCFCAGCVAQEAADRRGERAMMPLEIPVTAEGPDYRGVSEALAALDEEVPSTEPSGMVEGLSPQPSINVRREPRGPAS